MLIAHVTDPHLDGTDTPRQRLRDVASALTGTTTPVDLVLLTGDIVQSADFEGDDDRAIAEYRFAHDALAGIAPMAWCPGNVDANAYDLALRELFPGATGTNTRLETGEVTILMLDSRVRGELRGHLDDTALAWLEEELGRASTPVLVALHHPPVRIGHPVFDTLRLDNADALEAVLRRLPQVTGILFGHTHSAIATSFAGVPAFGAPGVHSSGQLPWDAREGESLIDPSAPPAYAVHRLDAHGLTSIPMVLR